MSVDERIDRDINMIKGKEYYEAVVPPRAGDVDAKELARVRSLVGKCIRELGNLLAQKTAFPHAAGHTVTTTSGETTVKDMHSTCRSIEADLRTRSAPGCGTRVLSFESLSLGGGQWAPASMDDTAAYAVDDCSNMPSVNKIGAPFRSVSAKALSTCGSSQVVVFKAVDWDVTLLDGGNVKRNTIAVCWRKGTFSDWLTP